MSRVVLRITVALGLASNLAPNNAIAQSVDAGPPTSAARWAWVRGEGAQRCADAPTLARAIEARLERRVFDERAPRSIEGNIERSAQRWRARWILRSSDGAIEAQRELSDDSSECDAIVEAVTLTVVLAIDPNAPMPAPTRPRTITAPPAQCPPATPQRAAIPAAPRPSDRSPVRTTARATATWGTLPLPAPGVGLAVDGRVTGRLRWMLDATFVPEQRVTASDRNYAFGYTGASAAACADMLDPGRFGLTFCGAVSLGVTHVVVFDIQPSQPGARPWLAAMIRARTTARIVGPLVIEAGLDAGIMAVRYAFAARGEATPVFTQSLGIVELFGGLGWEI